MNTPFLEDNGVQRISSLRLILFFGFLLPKLASAELNPLPFGDVTCRDQLIQVLSKWKTTGPWTIAQTEKIGKVFQAATTEVGKWVQIELKSNKTVFAIRLTAHSQVGFEWSAKDCHPSMKTAQNDFFPADKNDDFNDTRLAEVLSAHPEGGVLMLWSPGMPYSVAAIKNIEAVRQSLKVPVYYLLDSEAIPAVAEKWIQENALPQQAATFNRSFDLFMRGMQTHFPTLIVFYKGKFSSPLLPGLYTTHGYLDFIRSHLQ